MGEQWVINVNKELKKLSPSAESKTWARQSIHKVPKTLRDAHGDHCYTPKLAAIGPYHHGKEHLLPMEQHKRRALRHFLWRTNIAAEDVVTAMRKEVEELMAAYDELQDRWRNDVDGFLELMIVDGCFLLELMLSDRGSMGADYDEMDPVFSNPHVRGGVRGDAVMCENQLPLRVLSILTHLPGSSKMPADLRELILHFTNYSESTNSNHGGLGLHILDELRKHWIHGGDYSYTLWNARSATRLQQAGVRFEAGPSTISSIKFSDGGVVTIPPINMRGITEFLLLNLIAWENIHSAGGYEVTSYALFMDDLIENSQDVALLRGRGIIHAMEGSEEQVAAIFNRLTKGVAFSDGDGKGMNNRLDSYYKKKLNRWMASFVLSYLANPWVFFSLVGAIVLLLLTFLQTIYGMLAYYNSSSSSSSSSS